MIEKKVFIFGDSIAYGHSDYKFGGWANKLGLYLLNKKEEYYTVFNMSISGNTTNDVLTRFENEMNARCCSTDEIILIFAIGINDTKNINNKSVISNEEFRCNINELIEKTKIYTNNIVFLGLTKVDESKMIPSPWNCMECYLNKEIILFDSLLERICESKELKYIKLYDVLSLENLEDGIHPNTLGHEKLYKIIKDGLEV